MAAHSVDPDPKHLETALHLANLIQQQKDMEMRIFEDLEKLIDFPLDPNADPAFPSPAEAAQVQSLLSSFRPSDYDSLLEERRCADKCAYVLCPRFPKKQNTTAKLRILGKSKGQELRFVPTERLEMWCSDDCARRAVYVKVQLNEEPAWTRKGASANFGFLTGDVRPGEKATKQGQGAKATSSRETELAKHLANLSLASDDASLEDQMAILALERGDKSSMIPETVLAPNVVEIQPKKSPSPPSMEDMPSAHSRIEGYQLRREDVGPSSSLQQSEDIG